LSLRWDSSCFPPTAHLDPTLLERSQQAISLGAGLETASSDVASGYDDEDESILALRLGSHAAYDMRMAIWRELGYTCTAGIALNKMLAKMAGASHKPNDQVRCLCCQGVACTCVDQA